MSPIHIYMPSYISTCPHTYLHALIHIYGSYTCLLILKHIYLWVLYVFMNHQIHIATLNEKGLPIKKPSQWDTPLTIRLLAHSDTIKQNDRVLFSWSCNTKMWPHELIDRVLQHGSSQNLQWIRIWCLVNRHLNIGVDQSSRVLKVWNHHI